MQEIEKRIGAILKSLQKCESYEEQGEETRQEVKRLLDDFERYAGKVRSYYRQKYELDRPPAERLELGRKICELREQGADALFQCPKGALMSFSILPIEKRVPGLPIAVNEHTKRAAPYGVALLPGDHITPFYAATCKTHFLEFAYLHYITPHTIVV